MCKFENQLLLCTCENNSDDSLISWKLVRKPIENPQQEFKIIGQINIPDAYKNLSQEEYDNEVDKMLEYVESYRQKREELNNVVINIETELNTRNCFDKNIDLFEDDILSILIDKEFDMWANFVFVKSKWKIQD